MYAAAKPSRRNDTEVNRRGKGSEFLICFPIEVYCERNKHSLLLSKTPAKIISSPAISPCVVPQAYHPSFLYTASTTANAIYLVSRSSALPSHSSSRPEPYVLSPSSSPAICMQIPIQTGTPGGTQSSRTSYTSCYTSSTSTRCRSRARS